MRKTTSTSTTTSKTRIKTASATIKHAEHPTHANDNPFLTTGTVQSHRDGHAFVVRDGDDEGADVFLGINEARAVMHQDRVAIEITGQDRRGRPQGKVVDILSRSTKSIIGRLLHENGVWLVAPEDKRYGLDVLLTDNNHTDVKTGQVVVVTLTNPPVLFAQPMGHISEVLGNIDDAGMEIEIAVRKFNVPHEFSAACVAQAGKLADKVRPQDAKNRVDLTDIPLVTIDGEDARDFDDAVYCEPAKIGRSKGWRLLVAIADVSHYVENNSAIDVDAYERATSVYFPRRVIPMLPEKLSNGLCSLNPNVPRLCMVCDMLVTVDGEVHAYQFYPAVMFSHARFTYTDVAAILCNTNGVEAKNHAQRVPDLLNLYHVYQALLAARKARGAVDFETTETQIVANEHGKIEKIIARTRNDAHRLIEEAMLAANVCSADFIMQNKHTGLFRVHEGPTPEKKEVLRQYLKAAGIAQTISDEPSTHEFQAIALATKDRPDALQVHTMLLRSMQQAIYTPHNNGHFGLAFDAYTHFTSPIRRYPDLLVHRVIKAILQNQQYVLPTLPMPGEAQHKLAKRLSAKSHGHSSSQSAASSKLPQAPGKSPSITKDAVAWQAAGLHCSANERRADEASRDVQAWLKCKYMQDHVGESFMGVVSSVTSFGLFVTLEAMFVEGLVHITALGGDYFKFDEMTQTLRGERTGIKYTLGTRLSIEVARVDLDGRRIDFTIQSEAGRSPKNPPLTPSHPTKNAPTNSSMTKPAAKKAAQKENNAGAYKKKFASQTQTKTKTKNDTNTKMSRLRK